MEPSFAMKVLAHDLWVPLGEIEIALYKSAVDSHSANAIRSSLCKARAMINAVRSSNYDQLVNKYKGKFDFDALFVEGLTVDVSGDTHLEYILDYNKINRVLKNLLVNAKEANATFVKISLESNKDLGNLEVQVSNNGEKINTEVDIFNHGVTTKQNGTGLGLAYCMEVVEAHGGSINYVSAEGKTQFSFILPECAVNY